MSKLVDIVRTTGEDIGVIGGAKLSNALNYINQIAAKKSAKMFKV